MRLPSDAHLDEREDSKRIPVADLQSRSRECAGLQARQENCEKDQQQRQRQQKDGEEGTAKRLSAELLRQFQAATEEQDGAESAAASEHQLRVKMQRKKSRGQVSLDSGVHPSTPQRKTQSSKQSSGSTSVLEVQGPLALDDKLRPQLPPAAADSMAGDSLQASGSAVRQQLAASFVADTLSALPCRAESVSHLR